ncbi:hypothetical protein [Clostridium aminobutyricum]|uniref:Uncharacterized protein n=1 Tax=Clostridium aminobutyricum TaxID=33953 RepID=A0A939IJX5_CLOAM|nr:hypothetical protein [Clostridium aminobutyricum]MBN7774014.1 hypothetical protein [Clostridium aminobutyricum]
MVDKSFSGAVIVPYLLAITKGACDKYIQDNFELIVKGCHECGVAVGNLGWIEEFLARDIKVYGDYGLNLYNSEAIAWARETGLTDYVWSHEVFKGSDYGEEEVQECIFAGTVPFMISEHSFTKRSFTDRKNRKFKIIQDTFKTKNILVDDRDELNLLISDRSILKNAKRIRIYLN